MHSAITSAMGLRCTARVSRTFATVPGMKKVAIVGSGTLGSQIAFQTAICGYDVSVLDISQDAVDKCAAMHKAFAASFVARQGGAQARGWVGIADEYGGDAQAAADATLARLSYTTDAAEAMDGVDLISESVPENTEIKLATYGPLHKHAPAGAIFTTNSSTLLPSQFAEVTGRPERFMALHFANGIWDFNVAELMGHPGTDPKVYKQVQKFTDSIQMVPILIHKEQNGYVMNSLSVALMTAAQDLVVRGVASPEDVDRCYMLTPVGGPLGPFGLMDMIGLRTVVNVNNLWGKVLSDQHIGQQMLANGAFLQENYLDKGKLGIMTGNPATDTAEGFYTYPNPSYMDPDFIAIKK